MFLLYAVGFAYDIIKPKKPIIKCAFPQRQETPLLWPGEQGRVQARIVIHHSLPCFVPSRSTRSASASLKPER
jgi:hypothetical protein